ncbi:hypothetical protein E1N66_18780 [Pantoea allii]|nr:hypothetical protein [Pantoea allii]THB82849.1 hypothetical protein E1N66_18780 [Pantoea allii]
MKVKNLVISSIVACSLSGCASVMNTQASDYRSVCPSYNISKVDEGKVISVQRKAVFYITDSGSIYSKREIDAMNSPQSVLLSQLSGSSSSSDVSTAKPFQAIQYKISGTEQTFCGSMDYNNDNSVYEGQRLIISNVKGGVSSSEFYKNGNSAQSTGFTLKPYNN